MGPHPPVHGCWSSYPAQACSPAAYATPTTKTLLIDEEAVLLPLLEVESEALADVQGRSEAEGHRVATVRDRFRQDPGEAAPDPHGRTGPGPGEARLLDVNGLGGDSRYRGASAAILASGPSAVGFSTLGANLRTWVPPARILLPRGRRVRWPAQTPLYSLSLGASGLTRDVMRNRVTS